MANGANTPVSLDALLSANKQRFDSLFEQQMAAAPPPVAPAGRTVSTAPSDAASAPPHEDGTTTGTTEAQSPGIAGGENIVAELNKRFTITWSSETLERQIDNGRAVVRCRLTVGEDSRVESGSSRVAEDGEQAALDRALSQALKKCAERFNGGAPVRVPPARTPVPASASEPVRARLAALQARPLDVVIVDQVRTALQNARQEMDMVLRYGALSEELRDLHTELPLITDANGQMISGRFGSFVAHLIHSQDLHFSPGDVLLQSDPYLCGGAVSHLNDWMVLTPVFYGVELIGFTAMVGHISDVGGSMAGSMPAQASSIFGEGVRIPPVKIVEGDVLNEAALQLILNNSRTPDKNRTDLMALIAGCRAGQEQVIGLCDRFGPELYHRACTALLARSNQNMRQLILDRVPHEPQSFEDQIDDDGCGNGPFKLKLTVWREGDHAYFDWTGSAAQAPGPINLYLHVGLAKMFAGMCLADGKDESLLCNDGFYDLIHITLPKGSVLNPTFPAALGRRDHALVRQLDVLGNALGRHNPDQLTAAGYGSSPTMTYLCSDLAGRPVQFTDSLFGGLPGTPEVDGRDGHSLWPQAQSRPVEQMENNFPVVVESYASIADTGGAGLHRGGNGIEKVYRMLQPGEVSIQDDRHASHPWGVNGGKAGAVSAKSLIRADGTRQELPSKIDGLAVLPGDRIVFRTAGGGGCGDPLQRDPAQVRLDILRGLVTSEAAVGYGVVLTGNELQVDSRATLELREGLKRERKPLDLFDYGDPA